MPHIRLVIPLVAALLAAAPGARAEPAAGSKLKSVGVDEATLLKYPEQIVLVTSIGADGKHNIMTAGWTMFCSGSPPMLAVAIGKTRQTHALITQTRQFVIAFPGEELKDAVLLCGSQSGRDTDKFKAAGLTAAPGRAVKAPLIAECIANFECELVHAYDSSSHTIFVGRIAAAWARTDADQLRRLYNLGQRNFRALP